MKHCLEQVREKKPLIHCITNYVTVNDCANLLLGCGASPIMADDQGEVEEITGICGGLVLNIGTLNAHTIPSMLLAGKEANRLSHPVVLDPVGAGASILRTDTARRLVEEIRFSCIRGNMSEIKALVTGTADTQGVDVNVADQVTEASLPQAIAFVKDCAGALGTIVAVTGAIDLVSDGKTTVLICNGRPEMGKVTGTGCQLSALLAAYLTANPQRPLEAAAAAVVTMGLAGELAYAKLQPGEGNASYRNRILDAICQMTQNQWEEGARYEIR